MLQSRCHKQLHDNAENAQEDEIGPLGGVGGQLEGNAGNEEERKSGNEGAPDSKEIDADERMRTFANPANGSVSARSATYAKQCDKDGTEALCGSDLIEAVKVTCWHCRGKVD